MIKNETRIFCDRCNHHPFNPDTPEELKVLAKQEGWLFVQVTQEVEYHYCAYCITKLKDCFHCGMKNTVPLRVANLDKCLACGEFSI